jgi:hypothetical protein
MPGLVVTVAPTLPWGQRYDHADQHERELDPYRRAGAFLWTGGAAATCASTVALLAFRLLHGPRPRPKVNRDGTPALTAAQTDRVRRLHATFAEVDAFRLEERIVEVAAHRDAERELATWERMAAAYERFTAGRELSLQARNEAFKIVLLRSMSSEREVLRHQRLRVLSREDAIEIMRGM